MAGHWAVSVLGAYPGRGDGPQFAVGVWVNGMASTADPAQVVEDLSHAWMLGPDAHRQIGQTRPDEAMGDPGYTWCQNYQANRLQI